MTTPFTMRLKTHPDGTLSCKKIPPKLSAMEPLIDCWFRALKRYVDNCAEDDAPYWHTERASISILAGAAWLSGASALEEYHTEKTYSDGTKRGRGDLYILWPNDDCIVEAKVCWYPGQRGLAEQITSAMRDARANNEGEAAYACIFVVPRYSPSQPWALRDIIDSIIKEAPKIDIFAAYFPVSRSCPLPNRCCRGSPRDRRRHGW